MEKIKCRLGSNCMVALLKWVNGVMPTSFLHVRRGEPEEDINAFRVTFNKGMSIFNANSGLRPDWHLHHEFIRIGSPLKMSPTGTHTWAQVVTVGFIRDSKQRLLNAPPYNISSLQFYFF